MGTLLTKFCAKYSSPGLLKVARERNLDFEWVVEAGCHDGTDTLEFLKLPNIKRVFAFEPDDVAADKAQAKFTNCKERVDLKRLALMDQPGFIEISSPTGNFGDGTTVISNFKSVRPISGDNEKLLICSTMDIELPNLTGRGLLWLDVEGSAADVLSGSLETLKSVSLIQVEVEMHTSKHRKANFAKVDKILSKSNFSIIFGPLHPGYFGDAMYLKNSHLTGWGRLKSLALKYLYLILHLVIYPLTFRPRG
jgi:FkbM family methyltransferase